MGSQEFYCLSYNSPLGELRLWEEGDAIVRLDLPGKGAEEMEQRPSPLLKRAARELEEYFAGQRRDFDLPLCPKGSPFSRSVWDALREIPYGETVCYGDIAEKIGRPKAFRAVGQANHINPIPIIIPCHRVIGRDRSLTGYGGGLEVKSFLLRLEGVLL